jgi:hypothetical protein
LGDALYGVQVRSCATDGTASPSNKHAFLITAYSNPGQVQLLLDLLDDRRNDVFVKLDAKGDVAPGDLSMARGGLAILEPTVVNWAAFSMVRAELELISAAVPARYHYYHMITGSDLPLVSPEVMHERLAASDLEYVQFEPERAAEARYKAGYRHPFVDTPGYCRHLGLRGLRYGAALAQRGLGLERSSARGVSFHHGSSYFTITHQLAQYVADHRDWIEATFCNGLACDEVFLQTLVMRSHFVPKIAVDRMDSPANLRCIDWSRRVRNSPHTFTRADVAMLAAASRTALFARKFDSRIDSEVVAAVAKWVREPA